MHSIRTRITTLTVIAIFACALLIGAVSVFTVKAEEEDSSGQLMTLLCTTKCDAINSFLSSVEQSGETVAQFVYESLDVVAISDGGVIGATGSGRSLNKRGRKAEQVERFDLYLEDHLSDVEAVFSTIGANNASVLGYYYRINPEISSTVDGFWYSKTNALAFTKQKPTDITAYRVDDYSHVGWYYEAVDRGRPVWTEPYLNKNLNKEILSYLIPVYKAGTLIGVIGIDVSYESLVSEISDLEVLDTGYAYLTDSMGKIVYHPELENDVMLLDVNSEIEATQYHTESSALISYKYNGVRKRAAWSTLSNGLRLVVSAPENEINAGWRSLLWLIPSIALIIAALFIWVTLTLMGRLIEPLERLAYAAKQLAVGDYSVELTYVGDDEVGTLTRAFRQMASRLQFYVSDLDYKAHRDALTKVRNKRAFDLFCTELDKTIQSTEEDADTSLGIVMFDCNDLKPINDTYGHEKGDLYLQNACKLICRVFEHCPVFRVGGDEFVAVLQGDILLGLDELEQRFDQEAATINANASDAWECVSVAHGSAVFDPATDNEVEAVVSRADASMYENKRKYKEGHEGR